MVDISRSKISGLPLITLLEINGFLNKYQMLGKMKKGWRALDGWKNSTLKEWKKIKDSQLDIWMKKNQMDFLIETKQMLQESCEDTKADYFSIGSYSNNYAVLHRYCMACFQDKYQLRINYEDGQILSFCEKWIMRWMKLLIYFHQ